jgi:hypothetical protein
MPFCGEVTLILLVNARNGQGGASQAIPDGRKLGATGWIRIQIEVSDLNSFVETLRKADLRMRNDVVTGFGGKQILPDGPTGDPIELLEPPSK